MEYLGINFILHTISTLIFHFFSDIVSNISYEVRLLLGWGSNQCD